MAIMDDFLKKSKYLHNHNEIIKWSEEMERDMDIKELLTEHGRLQKVLAKIINKEVVNEDGKFHFLPEADEERLHQVEDRIRSSIGSDLPSPYKHFLTRASETIDYVLRHACLFPHTFYTQCF